MLRRKMKQDKFKIFLIKNKAGSEADNGQRRWNEQRDSLLRRRRLGRDLKEACGCLGEGTPGCTKALK